jgi:anti-anti-sigma factor
VVLSGESDVSAAAELTAAPTMQIVADARHLTVDLSGLRFADSASIQAFVRADRALKADGGTMELVTPEPAVARVRRAATSWTVACRAGTSG